MPNPSWEGFRKQVAELHSMLEELGVGYVFLKTVKPYPHADSNVDVLLPRGEDFRRVKEALLQRGYRPVFTLEFDKALLLPPPSPSEVPAAHLYRGISWYTVPYLDAEAVLRRARVVPWEGQEIPIPSPRDDFRIGALHAFFEQEALTRGDFWHLRHVQRELDAEADLHELSGAARWALQAVREGLTKLSESLPPELHAMDPKREREVVYAFPERVLLRGFALRTAEALRRRRLRDLAGTLYAYGLVHPAKKLRWIRG